MRIRKLPRAKSRLHLIFCHNLRRLREAKGLTQSEVAKKLHLARHTVTQIETGRCVPRLDTVERMAKAVGESPRRMLQA